MSSLSHFQIYSGKENHATNNTLLMLRHVQRSSSRLFQALMRSLLDRDALALELDFRQQERAVRSIPDGRISQPAFDLFIETKRGGTLDEVQMLAHLDGIGKLIPQSNQTFLLGLTKARVEPMALARLHDAAKDARVHLAVATFHDIVSGLREICRRSPDLDDIVADYESYLDDAGLLPEEGIMAVFASGESHRENLKHNVYYEPSSRPTKAHCRYIGLYGAKRVSAIADMGRVIVREPTTAEPAYRAEGGSAPTKAEVDLIETVIADTPYYRLGQQVTRFYLVTGFHDTAWQKVSAGGIRGFQRLRPLDALPTRPATPPPASDLAERLRDRVFE